MTILERYGTVLRCYDNGGKTFDRYTVLPPRWARDYRDPKTGMFEGIAASTFPFYPQGFGQHTTADPGPHLGRRVKWGDLPEDVRRFAQRALWQYAP